MNPLEILPMDEIPCLIVETKGIAARRAQAEAREALAEWMVRQAEAREALAG